MSLIGPLSTPDSLSIPASVQLEELVRGIRKGLNLSGPVRGHFRIVLLVREVAGVEAENEAVPAGQRDSLHASSVRLDVAIVAAEKSTPLCRRDGEPAPAGRSPVGCEQVEGRSRASPTTALDLSSEGVPY